MSNICRTHSWENLYSSYGTTIWQILGCRWCSRVKLIDVNGKVTLWDRDGGTVRQHAGVHFKFTRRKKVLPPGNYSVVIKDVKISKDGNLIVTGKNVKPIKEKNNG